MLGLLIRVAATPLVIFALAAVLLTGRLNVRDEEE